MEGSSSNGACGGGSFTRQLNGRDTWNASKRWRRKGPERSMKQIEGLDMASENGVVLKKRVMVLVDQSTHAKDAMLWALTHVANKGDHLTLLEIIAPHKAQRKRDNISGSSYSSSTDLANSLIAVCRAFKPEVEVEALAVQGPKLPTVISQVKKLEASVLVLGQKKPSPVNWQATMVFNTSAPPRGAAGQLNEDIRLCSWSMSRSEDFVEQCIGNAECLTVAVRKQSRDVGGYLISTRWQKNFWLLA